MLMGNPFKKPKAPRMPEIKPPKPIPPRAEMVDLQAEGSSGASNFVAEKLVEYSVVGLLTQAVLVELTLEVQTAMLLEIHVFLRFLSR